MAERRRVERRARFLSRRNATPLRLARIALQPTVDSIDQRRGRTSARHDEQTLDAGVPGFFLDRCTQIGANRFVGKATLAQLDLHVLDVRAHTGPGGSLSQRCRKRFSQPDVEQRADRAAHFEEIDRVTCPGGGLTRGFGAHRGVALGVRFSVVVVVHGWDSIMELALGSTSDRACAGALGCLR